MKHPVNRSLIAIVVGVVVAALVVAIVEYVGALVFPIPDDIDVMDAADLAANLDRIPTGAKWAVLLAWARGAFSGSWVAAQMGRRWGMRWTMRLGMIVGVVVLAVVAVTLLMIAHPMWMTVVGLVMPLPAAWLGAALVGKPKHVPQG